MDSTPIPPSFLRRLFAGELPLSISCACGLGLILFWTAVLGGLGFFITPQKSDVLETLGTWGRLCCLGLLLPSMAASTLLVRRGIFRSKERFRGWRPYALMAHVFYCLMLFILLFQMFSLPALLYLDFIVSVIVFVIVLAVILAALGHLVSM